MALTYDLQKVKQRDTSEAGFIVTKAIIFSSMSVRIWNLTDENASEWYARIHFCEKHLGETILTRGSGDPVHVDNPNGYQLTPADIHANIGVETNQGEDVGRRDWIRRLVQRHHPYVDTYGGKKYTYKEIRDLLAKYADEYLAYVLLHD